MARIAIVSVLCVATLIPVRAPAAGLDALVILARAIIRASWAPDYPPGHPIYTMGAARVLEWGVSRDPLIVLLHYGLAALQSIE